MALDLFVSFLVILVFICFVTFMNPIATVASRQTASYLSHQYPYQGFNLRKRKYIPTSTSSGYFVYEFKVGGNNLILKTSYTQSSNITSFITESVKEEE